MADEAVKLAQKVAKLVQELGVEGGDDGDADDYQAKKKAADKLIGQGLPGEALQAAMAILEAMLRMSVNSTQAPAVKKRIREIMWDVKDAIAALEEAGDKGGKAIALQALARAHLTRSGEPDAPNAAVRAVGDAIKCSQESGDMRKEAGALGAAVDAHMFKAGLTPFEKVAMDEIELAVQCAQGAVELYRKLDDKKGEAEAMHKVALALLSLNDDDKTMDAERYADDARDILRTIKAKGLEAQVTFTIIKMRWTTSGPEAAAMLAKDAVEDWKGDADRKAYQAAALLKVAELSVEGGELDEALQAGKDAYALYTEQGKKRGVVEALHAMHNIYNLKGDKAAALRYLKEAIPVCQDLKDRRLEGTTMYQVASFLLGSLVKDVEVDMDAQAKKKDPVVGLSTDDVYTRGEEGLDFAGRSFECFEDAGDDAGMQAVQDLIQNCFQKGIDLYASSVEPDKIYTTLEVDGPTTKETKFEWRVTIPRSKRLAEGSAEGGGQIIITA